MAEFRTTLLFGADTPDHSGVTLSLPEIATVSGSGTTNALPEPDLLTVLTRIWNAQGASFRAVLSGYVRPSPASAYEDWEPDGDQPFTITNLTDAPPSEAPPNQYETKRLHGATATSFQTVPPSAPAPLSDGSVAIKVGRAKMLDPAEPDPYDESKWVWVDIYIKIEPTISLRLYPSLRDEGYLCDVTITIRGEEYAASDYYLPITPEFPEEGKQWWAPRSASTWRNTFEGIFASYRGVVATFNGPPAAGTSDIAGGDSLGVVDVIEVDSDVSGDQGPRLHFTSINCAITAAYGARTPTTA